VLALQGYVFIPPPLVTDGDSGHVYSAVRPFGWRLGKDFRQGSGTRLHHPRALCSLLPSLLVSVNAVRRASCLSKHPHAHPLPASGHRGYEYTRQARQRQRHYPDPRPPRHPNGPRVRAAFNRCRDI